MEKDRLHTVNDGEVERLVERWMSDECFNAVMSFFQAKSKLWAKLFFSGSRKQTLSQQQIFSMNSAHDLWFHLHFQFAHKQKNLEISVKSFYASLKKFIDKLSHFLDMEWKFAAGVGLTHLIRLLLRNQFLWTHHDVCMWTLLKCLQHFVKSSDSTSPQ